MRKSACSTASPSTSRCTLTPTLPPPLYPNPTSTPNPNPTSTPNPNPTPSPSSTPNPAPTPHPFDLKVSAIGKYAHTAGTGSAANGKAGSFGSVNVGYGEI